MSEKRKWQHECPTCRDAHKTWEQIAEEERERRRKALAGRDAHKIREFEASRRDDE